MHACTHARVSAQVDAATARRLAATGTTAATLKGVYVRAVRRGIFVAENENDDTNMKTCVGKNVNQHCCTGGSTELL